MPKQSSELIIDRPYDASLRRGGSGATTVRGATTFLGLSDTPSSYSGADGYFVVVDEATGALIFQAGGTVTSVNGQTGVVVLDTDDVAEGIANLYLTQERVEDFVGAMVSGNTETGIAVTYDDGTGKLNFDAQTAGDARYAPIAKGVTNGDSHDHSGGDGATIAYSSLSGTPTVYTQEEIEDFVGAMVSSNTETGIAVTYDDATGKLNFDAQTAGDARYAPIAKGVTNGDSHDHNGGDGGTIAYSSLSGTPTVYTQEQIEDFVGAMLGGTQTGITVAYVDASGLLTFDAQTAGDARYGRLATANTWTQNQTLNSTQTSGSALAITRNLTSTSTDSPVANIIQDHASDDQAVLRIQQDGSGNILQLYDGATLTFSVADGGAVNAKGAVDFDSTLNVDGAATFQSTVTLSPGGTQDYSLSDDGANALTLNALGAGKDFDWRLHTQDADGTDNVLFTLYAVGKPGAYTNYERGRLLYAAAGLEFRFDTGAAGSGTVRPLVLLTQGNTNQIRLLTDGKVVFGMATTGGNRLGMVAGSSTNDAAVGGVLYVDTTSTGNVGTGEDTLASYTIPASTLAVNGQSVWYEASGTFAANGNTKTLRVDLGGTDIVTTTAGPSTSWAIRGRIIRTGSTTVICSCQINLSAGGVAANASATVTLSSSAALTVTGEATANNDIVCNMIVVGYDDNNT